MLSSTVNYHLHPLAGYVDIFSDDGVQVHMECIVVTPSQFD